MADSWKLLPDNLKHQIQNFALYFRATGTDDLYLAEGDPVTGAFKVAITESAVMVRETVHIDLAGSPVTTGAWTELVASTSNDVTFITVDETSGQGFEIGVGAAAAETRLCVGAPGGLPGQVQLYIAAGTRVSIRAITGDMNSGDLFVNLFGT